MDAEACPSEEDTAICAQLHDRRTSKEAELRRVRDHACHRCVWIGVRSTGDGAAEKSFGSSGRGVEVGPVAKK